MIVTVKMIEVIEVVDTIGSGLESDPFRRIRAYYDPQGTLLATDDSWLSQKYNETIKQRKP